ncbi:hypothetical protein [Peribacillus sp. Hz7]
MALDFAAVTDVVAIAAAIVSRNHHLVIADVDVEIDVKNHQIETEITSI